MTEKLLGVLIIGLVGAALIFARRFQNKDTNAGYGIAGWIIFIIFLWLESQ